MPPILTSSISNMKLLQDYISHLHLASNYLTHMILKVEDSRCSSMHFIDLKTFLHVLVVTEAFEVGWCMVPTDVSGHQRTYKCFNLLEQ
jgi:hypothetical protein